MGKRVKNGKNSNGSLPDVYLICEGDDDENLLAILTQKILRQNHSRISVAVVPAHGKQQIPGFVSALDDQAEGQSRLGIVVDSDGQIEATKSFLRRNLDLENYFVVIAHPSVGSWFGEEIKDLAGDPRQTRQIVDQLDLEEIERKHPEVAVLRENLTRKSATASSSRVRSTAESIHSHS
jgi:hypothetical protein